MLVTKLRAVNSPDAHQTRKAVRATLILIPLLGLQYVLTPFRPPPGSPGEAAYEILAALFTSFQGLCVAMLFCFFNGEVMAALKKVCTQKIIRKRPLQKRPNNNCTETIEETQVLQPLRPPPTLIINWRGP